MSDDIRATLLARHIPAATVDKILHVAKQAADALGTLKDPTTGRIDPGRVGPGGLVIPGVGTFGGPDATGGFVLPGKEDLGAVKQPGQGSLGGLGGLGEDGGLTLPSRSDLGATKGPNIGHKGGTTGITGLGGADGGLDIPGRDGLGKGPGTGTGVIPGKGPTSVDDGGHTGGAVLNRGTGRPKGGGGNPAADGEQTGGPAQPAGAAPAAPSAGPAAPDSPSTGPAAPAAPKGGAAPPSSEPKTNDRYIDPRTRDDSIRDDFWGNLLVSGIAGAAGAVMTGANVAKEVVVSAIGDAIIHIFHKGSGGGGTPSDQRPTDDQSAPVGPKGKAGQVKTVPMAVKAAPRR